MNPPGSPFDPKVAYDHYVDRWIILALAYSRGSNPASSYLISVSQSADPTGNWNNFKLDATLNGSQPSNTWADYPGLGFDHEAIYLTSNQYEFGGRFRYAKIRILNKSQLYNNQTPTWTDFWDMRDANGVKSTTIKPAHHFDSPTACYLVNTRYSGANYITLWRIDNPINNPVLTRQASITVSSYSVPPDAEQKGSDQRIDTGDSRTQDTVYRDGFIYTAFTTAYNWGSGTVSAIRYVKINVSSNTAEWDATYGSDGVYYYYPAIYVDRAGNMVMVFNRSSNSEYAGVYWTYRHYWDNNAQLSRLLKAGEGAYKLVDDSGRNRWGDYNGIALDPTEPHKIWFYGEWARDNNTWSTWVGSFEFIPIKFTNKIGNQNPGGQLLIHEVETVNSGDVLELANGFEFTVKTLNERFLNWSGTSDYKHHNWNDVDLEYKLFHSFKALTGNDQDANFKEMNPVTIRTDLISAGGSSDGTIDFKDPWYVDEHGNQPDSFLTFSAPYKPTGSALDTTGGVFLNQPYTGNNPHYSVRAPLEQVIPFHNEEVTWYFQLQRERDGNLLGTEMLFKTTAI